MHFKIGLGDDALGPMNPDSAVTPFCAGTVMGLGGSVEGGTWNDADGFAVFLVRSHPPTGEGPNIWLELQEPDLYAWQEILHRAIVDMHEHGTPQDRMAYLCAQREQIEREIRALDEKMASLSLRAPSGDV